MSNTQVGSVYQRIIEEVIAQCRAPFEEEGTRAEVLDDFKKTWQDKISERKVAQMPWDPPPAPLPPAAQQPPQPRPTQYVPPQGQPSNADIKPVVKSEPHDLASLGGVQYGHAAGGLAVQNARDALNARFGDRAQHSIQQLEQRIPDAPHGVKRSLPQSSPTQESYDVKRQQTDYNRGVSQQAQQQLQQLSAAQRAQHGAPPLGAGQTDGAADWKQMVAERRALAAEGSAAADMTIAQRVAAMQRAEEGGGVMQPHSATLRALNPARGPVVSKSSQGGFDGADEDEDGDDIKPRVDDADAINSDLDDSDDDNHEEDEDNEKDEEIMVCTYEKVARVKNKWKCTLKDGILITGGKEYVFGKATGEFEW